MEKEKFELCSHGELEFECPLCRNKKHNNRIQRLLLIEKVLNSKKRR